MITYHGIVTIPPEVTAAADTIKHENYKVNSPAKFKVRSLDGCDWLMARLGEVVDVPRERLDCVYFSCCKGAEPHADQLNPAKFTDTTYVIPVVVPSGRSVLVVDGREMDVQLGGIYQFNHGKIHELRLDDTESGCVVIMVGVLQEGWSGNRRL